MGTVHVLKGSSDVHSLKLRKRRDHDVWIKVVDKRHPKQTRWLVQFAISRARGFPANKGFTDAFVRAGKWHNVKIRGSLLSRFAVRDLGPLIADDLVWMEIDGKELQARESA